MKISTFDDDLLELEDFSHRLEDFIATEDNYVDGSLVLALTSKYGSGKTTFLEMWKSSMSNSDKPDNKPLVISLNAWESDYYGDPLYAIISALVESPETKGKSLNSLVDAANYFGRFAAAIGGQLVNKFTGIDPVAAVKQAEKKKGKHEEPTQTTLNTFSEYLNRKVAMRSLKREIESFVAASEPRVLFLIDELDRCRPDYAITYLETIKHIFDIKGAVFLLAADRQHLENSAKTAFGPDLDFEEYYRKFIHREIPLPKITGAGYKRLASEYVAFYLEREGERYCFMNFDHYTMDDVSEFIASLKLTPRQLQEVFRILGHILSISEEKKGRIRRSFGFASIAMAAFKVADPSIFDLLGSRKLECDNAVNYLKQTLNLGNFKWWFLLLLSGGGIHMNAGETEEDLIKRAGLADGDGEISTRGAAWESLCDGWGYQAGQITGIHEKIEQISQWE